MLSSDDPFVTFNDLYGDFSTIAGNGAVSTGRFGIRIAGNCPDKRFMNFNLTVTDVDGISWIINFSLQINGTPTYNLVSFTLYSYSGDGDQNLDAGEQWYPSITIQNNGSVRGYSVRAYFTSSDPYFSYYYSYSNRDIWYGTIQPKTSVTQSSSSANRFLISSSTPAGRVMTFQVRITDSINTLGWIFNFSRVVVAAQPPPPGDAGYTTDAGNSTATALSLNLEQSYSCSLSANDLVDYFRVNVMSSHQYLWIYMSDCSSCSHSVQLYNSGGNSLGYSISSNYIRLYLNNQTGIFYIKVYASQSYYAGYYTIRATFTDPNAQSNPPKPSPTLPNTAGILIGCLCFIIMIGVIAYFAKPEKRKKAREWYQTVQKRWNSPVNARPSSTSHSNKTPSTSTTIREQRFIPCTCDELLHQASDHQTTAEGYVATNEYLAAEKEWVCVLNKYHKALTLILSSKEKNRVRAEIPMVEENIVQAIIGQADLAFEKAMEYHRNGEIVEAHAQYQEAIQKYKQGLEKAKNIDNHRIELVFPQAEQNLMLCQEYLDQVLMEERKCAP